MARCRSFTTAVCTAALIAGGALVATVPSATSAGADTITVTNTADDGSATSLRYLLQTAGPGDVFELAAGATYDLTRCEVEAPEAGAQFTLSSGELQVFETVTINGNGATIRQTCEGWRVIHAEESLTLDGVTITGGNVSGGGGGVRLDSAIFSADDAPLPQGEFPTLIIRDSSIVGNCSTGSGGGFKMNTDGDVEIYNSTIADNEADDNGGGFSHSHVGSVYMENSTVSNNAASGVGGVEVRNGDLTAVYSDIVDNSLIEGTTCDLVRDVDDDDEGPAPAELLYPSNLVVNGEGSVFFSFGTVVALRNNGDVNCAAESTVSSGYNYADDASCGFDQTTDTQNGADPQLAALGTNGGPTATRLPSATSPLVDAIPTTACSDGDELAGSVITTDQRYLARPDIANQKCDIGAVEVQTEAVEIQPNFTG